MGSLTGDDLPELMRQVGRQVTSMEPMLKVVEVAELMGCSSQYIRRMAKDGKIQGQKQDNGGNTLEWVFPVSALAEPYQQMYFDQQKQPSAVALAQKLSGEGTHPKKPLDHYTADEREAIAFWMRLVSDWLDYRKKPGANKAEVDEKFVLLCSHAVTKYLTKRLIAHAPDGRMCLKGHE